MNSVEVRMAIAYWELAMQTATRHLKQFGTRGQAKLLMAICEHLLWLETLREG